MDHLHYNYSAIKHRAPMPLASSLHVFAVLYLEHWDFEAPEGSVRDPRFVGEFGSFNPDYRSWTQREYGLRIGVFRLIEALLEAGIQPVVAANSLVLPRVPQLVQTLKDANAEWLGHGMAATRLMHANMPLKEQQEHIASSLAALQTATGESPKGWVSQDWGTSPHTFGLLADAGVRYTLDWGNDDQAYWMLPAGNSQQSLLALPMSSEWDDVQGQWFRPVEPSQHAAQMMQAAEQMRDECQTHQRAAVMGLGLHPWVWGMPSRIRYLRELLMQMKIAEGMTLTTPQKIYEQCANAQNMTNVAGA
jgi:peptidoglycan/xylan/chitin deacetylase (PgdA/CDA1 family)